MASTDVISTEEWVEVDMVVAEAASETMGAAEMEEAPFLYENCYCTVAHAPELDRIIKNYGYLRKSACKSWKNGKKFCEECKFFVKALNHEERFDTQWVVSNFIEFNNEQDKLRCRTVFYDGDITKEVQDYTIITTCKKYRKETIFKLHRARPIQMNNQLSRTVEGPSSPNALESSKTPEVEKIINLLQKSSSVENGLKKAWDEKNPKDSASTFLELFLYLDHLAEKTSEVVYHTTAIANQHEIWKLLDYSKEDFMELIQYEERIKPLCEDHERTVKRKQGSRRTIARNWKEDWELVLDPKGSFLPGNLSENFLLSLANISKSLSIPGARSRIKAAITTRINSGNKTRKYEYAINQDLVSIIKEEKVKKQQVLADGIRQHTLAERDSRMGAIQKAGYTDNRGDESGREELEQEEIAADEEEEEVDLEQMSDVHNPGIHLQNSLATIGMDRQHEADDESDEDSGNESGLNKIRRTVHDFSTERENRRVQPCKCAEGIPKALFSRIKGFAGRRDYSDVQPTIRELESLGQKNIVELCSKHLTMFAKGLGLKTRNSRQDTLQDKIQFIWMNRFRLGELLVHKNYYQWFRKGARPSVPQDKLGVWKYEHPLRTKFEFNSESVFTRFSSKETHAEFMKFGNCVAKGACSWMIEDEEVNEWIHEEIRMYLWHRGKEHGEGSYGWLRNCYHSLLQQAARQDLVYYALVVAARPDKNYKLICFPHYIKAALPGDYIFFRHVDLNIPKYIQHGRGASRIQTSLTLTQETENSCTMVIPGFQNHFKDWWKRVQKRGHHISPPHAIHRKSHSEVGSNCTKIDTIYLAEDEKDFGPFVPCICGPGDVRITRPEILHGSGINARERSEQRRYVVNPWWEGVQEDLQTTDIPESGNRTKVAEAHLNLHALNRTPSGQAFGHIGADQRFPAAVELRGVLPISDAMLGLYSWKSPLVMKDVCTLLGNNAEDAWALVKWSREIMKKKWGQAYQQMVSLEKELYGKNSYFNYVESGGVFEPTSIDQDVIREANDIDWHGMMNSISVAGSENEMSEDSE
ncbi:hypothetical protein DFH27DRAFT_637468 [Peziza echinospora]|nr:hypothetical protein DFH27DRAFT_637468 [Peziza echinospora]